MSDFISISSSAVPDDTRIAAFRATEGISRPHEVEVFSGHACRSKPGASFAARAMNDILIFPDSSIRRMVDSHG